jgi:mycothiol synthase
MPRVTTAETLPAGFTLRAAAPGDEATVAALGIAQDLDDLGEADYDQAEVEAEWAVPEFEPERDARLVFTDEGEPVAYASYDGHDARVFLDPRFKGRGIGSHLAAWIEAKAQVSAPRDIVQQVFGTNDAARQLLAACGYRTEQHYWRMRIDLHERAPALPEWPRGVTPLRYEPNRDEIDVHRLIDRAFVTIPGNRAQPLWAWRARWGTPARVDPKLTTVVVGTDGDAIGIATCAVQDDGGAYLSQLAVDQHARGRGLGRALLLETFRLANDTGVPRVALDVNASNENATRLYESAGMRVEWHSDRWVKQVG